MTRSSDHKVMDRTIRENKEDSDYDLPALSSTSIDICATACSSACSGACGDVGGVAPLCSEP